MFPMARNACSNRRCTMPPKVPAFVSPRASSPVHRIGYVYPFVMETVTLPRAWSPSSGSVTAAVSAMGASAGTTGTRTVWPTAARSVVPSRMTAGRNPTRSRLTTWSAAYMSGMRFVSVFAMSQGSPGGAGCEASSGAPLSHGGGVRAARGAC
jgi:hypothetical protein